MNDLVAATGLTQPQVSKHLRVLREVGAVSVRERGRQRLYRLDPLALKPVHDWVRDYARMWERAVRGAGRRPRGAHDGGWRRWR